MNEKLPYYLLIALILSSSLFAQKALPDPIQTAKYCTAIYKAQLFRESPVFKTIKKMIYNHEIRLNHKLNTQISLELFVPSAFTSFLKNKKLDLFHYPKFKSGLLHHLATRFKEKTLSIRFSDNEKTFEEYFSGFFIPCI